MTLLVNMCIWKYELSMVKVGDYQPLQIIPPCLDFVRNSRSHFFTKLSKHLNINQHKKAIHDILSTCPDIMRLVALQR